MRFLTCLVFVLVLASYSVAGVIVPNYTEFSHFIPQRYGDIFSSYSWWNGNYVSTATHAMSDPYRYKMMPVAWKEANKPFDVVTKWCYRTPNGIKAGVVCVLDVGVRTYEVVKVEKEFSKGEISEREREINHARNVIGMVGGWAVGYLGCTIGGAVGSFVVPGPGTVVGVVIGGGAGYYAGNSFGEYMATVCMEAFIDKFGTIAEVKEKAKTKIIYAAGEVKEAAIVVGHGVKVAAVATGHGTKVAAIYVSDKACVGWNGAKNVACSGYHAVGGLVASVGGWW